jgi:hypothetical protein
LFFYNYGFVNIGYLYDWPTRCVPYVNNQTSATVSRFYDWAGSYWAELSYSVAWDLQPASYWNDSTDGVLVC